MSKKPGKVGEILLKTIGAAGVISVAVLAPNALQALDEFGLIEGPKTKRRKYYMKNALARLEKRGWIRFVNKKGVRCAELTKRGEEELLLYQLRDKVIDNTKRWDKKWRIVIFDIKEYKRSKRNRLRAELNNLGFEKLQNSVWVYPYPCDELIVLIKAYFQLGKEVLFLESDRLENDNWLKKKFGLE